MPSPELSSLLRLIDDPSPRVADRVAARLASLGEGVWDEIEEQHIVLSPSQRIALQLALSGSLMEESIAPRGEEATARLRTKWGELGDERDETRFLEGSLWALSSWLRGQESTQRGEEMLEELAASFRASGAAFDAPPLSRFLFGSGTLRGVESEGFHDPRSSDLLWALEEGAGLPITLSCVFMLVGARLRIEIEGCNFPGHFLVRDKREHRVFDPFNGGKMMSAREVGLLRQAAPLEMNGRASSRAIVARIARNLSVAFHSSGQNGEAELLVSLLKELDGN